MVGSLDHFTEHSNMTLTSIIYTAYLWQLSNVCRSVATSLKSKVHSRHKCKPRNYIWTTVHYLWLMSALVRERVDQKTNNESCHGVGGYSEYDANHSSGFIHTFACLMRHKSTLFPDIVWTTLTLRSHAKIGFKLQLLKWMAAHQMVPALLGNLPQVLGEYNGISILRGVRWSVWREGRWQRGTLRVPNCYQIWTRC